MTTPDTVSAGDRLVLALSLNASNEIKRLDTERLPWLEQQRDQLEILAEKAKKEQEDIEKGLKEPPPRELLPQQIVWAHDAMKDSVISGRTY